MRHCIVALAVLVLSVGLCLTAYSFHIDCFPSMFMFVEPFGTVAGPVSAVECWEYSAKVKFGDIEWEECYHSLERYDREGNKIEIIRYTFSGEVQSRQARKFDEAGRLVQILTYRGSERWQEKTVILYSEDLVRYRSYDREGNVLGAYNEEYGLSGNVERLVTFDLASEMPESYMNFSYTQEGEVSLLQCSDENGELWGDYRYDYEGFLMDVIEEDLKPMSFDHHPTRGIMLSKRDQYDNWTEAKLCLPEEGLLWIPIGHCFRAIRYYEE